MKKRDSTKNQELARKARRIIISCSTHEVANLTAPGIAQQLGVSPCPLSRAYRSRTPGEFCRKIRKQRRSYLEKKKQPASL